MLPSLKDAFINNLNSFATLFTKRGRNISEITQEADTNLNSEVLKFTRSNNRHPTAEELSAIASRHYSDSNLYQKIIRVLDWKKLRNTDPDPLDVSLLPNLTKGINFKVKAGKIVDEQGDFMDGEVKVVIDDNYVYYARVLNDTYWHSRLVGGKPVDGAYTLIFNQHGDLVEYNNISGHYLTPPERLELLQFKLEKTSIDLRVVRRQPR